MPMWWVVLGIHEEMSIYNFVPGLLFLDSNNTFAIHNADTSSEVVDIKGNKVVLTSFKYDQKTFDEAFGLTSVGGQCPCA